jgi:hypothetical protein
MCNYKALSAGYLSDRKRWSRVLFVALVFLPEALSQLLPSQAAARGALSRFQQQRKSPQRDVDMQGFPFRNQTSGSEVVFPLVDCTPATGSPNGLTCSKVRVLRVSFTVYCRLFLPRPAPASAHRASTHQQTFWAYRRIICRHGRMIFHYT